MDPAWLFVTQVVVYAAFPIYFATLRTEMRLSMLYLYIGVVLTVGGFLGSVHGYPLHGDVVISAGSVSYGALMMSTLMLVFVGRDLQVVRNVVRIVIVVNVFKVALFQITTTALRDDRYPNPFETSPSVFSVSLRVVFIGGALIVGELVLLLYAFEWLKTRVENQRLLAGLYVACFVAVLCLDGVLFSVAVLPWDQMAEAVQAGVRAKFVLALAFSVPLVAFLLGSRSNLAQYAATPLRLSELVVAPRGVLLRELEQERTARRASDERRASTSALAQAMASLEPGTSIEEDLAAVGRALSEIPGMRSGPIGMVIVHDDDAVTEHGTRPDGVRASAAELRAKSATGPWVDRRELDAVACLPIQGAGGSVAGIMEVSIDSDPAHTVLASLEDAAVQATPVLRPALDHVRRSWAERSPIVSILRTGDIQAVFQPVVDLDNGAITSFEGLSRFEPGISPEGRFREAQRLGLGTDLQLLAVRTILEESAVLPPGLPVAINVSPDVVLDPRLAELLAGHDRSIKLEVTEHDRVDDYERLSAAIAAIEGVRLSIDDAGSGYATLQHILRLAPHEVKLDRSWVQDLDRNRARQVLVQGMAKFVAEIGADLVGEGIERQGEADTLRSLGVRFGQGYLFARPAPAATFRS